MPQALRIRFWTQAVLGSATGILAIVTLVWSDWLEAIVGLDPDSGHGSAERAAVIALLVITLALGSGAHVEWRRARLAHR